MVGTDVVVASPFTVVWQKWKNPFRPPQAVDTSSVVEPPFVLGSAVVVVMSWLKFKIKFSVPTSNIPKYKKAFLKLTF